jgi:hypothetical protein
MVRAVNTAGQATCLARLTVTPLPQEEAMERTAAPRRERLPQNPPEFARLFKDQTAKPGDSVTFEAIITGSPKPKVCALNFCALLLLEEMFHFLLAIRAIELHTDCQVKPLLLFMQTGQTYFVTRKDSVTLLFMSH